MMMRVLGLASLLCLLASQPVAAVQQVVEAQPAKAVTGDYPPLPTEAFAGTYFVTQQYRDMLGRDPENDGLVYWTTQLDDGAPPAELIAQLVDSPEFGAVRIPVARLYSAALGRLPEHDGWQYWSNRLATGESLESIAAALIATPEGQDRLPQTNADGFIDALYNNVLDRQPDLVGRDFWRGTLRSGHTMASVVVDFAESPEFANKMAPRIHASLLYEGLLNRTPESEGLTFWTSELAEGRSYVSAIGAFIDGPEYEQRLQSLWCNTVSLDEALDWAGGERDFDERYEQANETSDVVLQALVTNGERPDEITAAILDSKPQNSFVIGVHAPALNRACLPILALAPHPEVIQFAPTPATQSELEAAKEVIRGLAAPVGSVGVGSGRGRLNVELSATALSVADQIATQFEPLLETFRVGAFAYPMPDPLPNSVCRTESSLAVDGSVLGLSVTVDLPASVVSGGVASGTFTVTNTGTETHTLYWGYEVTGFLGSGGVAESTFTGFRFDPLTVATLGPSESVTGRLDIGTTACDPADGYALVPGTYLTWGSIAVAPSADHVDPTVPPAHFLRLPAVSLTLTD